MSWSSSTPLTKISMPRASGDLWNAGNVVLICREIMLKNDNCFTVNVYCYLFIKLVLELIECPSYVTFWVITSFNSNVFRICLHICSYTMKVPCLYTVEFVIMGNLARRHVLQWIKPQWKMPIWHEWLAMMKFALSDCFCFGIGTNWWNEMRRSLFMVQASCLWRCVTSQISRHIQETRAEIVYWLDCTCLFIWCHVC